MESTNHPINNFLSGLIDMLVRNRCPECKQELSVHDYNPEYKATFCYICYDWVPSDKILHIDTDKTKPCPKCESRMFCIMEIWEKVLGRVWCYTPHRWGCVCGHEEPFAEVG